MGGDSDPRRGSGPNGTVERDVPFALFIESVKDYAIFMLDPTGHVLTWNVGAERLKQYRADEIVGQHLSAFYPPEDRAANKPERLLAAAAAGGRVEDEGWRLRKDGTRFWADVVITAVRDPTGELVGFGKVTRDLTEVHERQAALEHAVQDLRRANQSLETFMRSLTHDIGGPLRSIRNFAEILLQEHAERFDAETSDYVRRIATGSQRLSNLVQSLLAFFRMTRSGETPPLEPVSWDAVIADACRDLQSELDSRAPKCRVGDRLGTVRGYREFLTIIIENLLRNAAKFVSPGIKPTITVASERRDGWIRLSVCDNGIGISAADQHKIFEPFKRLHTRAAYEGAGLGLAIVKNAVNRMGGACGVESEVGKGSCFWVDLKAAE